ncbi:PAS domain-containing protein [Krasilnikovia sp. MM14-A1004]|uniref:PAS domain-containing protein n=1 Tax=Krasilnikovia sp. MM14-A1004 TaxID=3373541 RepID=UPI00399CD9F5
MTATQVRPTGIARTFGDDELIVTKTDPRGIITYANDVFLRVSALTEEGAIGYPHSVIRHPDMPRAVFKLLWDTLEMRQEMFAYIQNLAVDGAHYWVFAHVTPTIDVTGQVVGYHSNRRTPDASAVAAVTELYAELRAEEQRHAGARQAVAASAVLLEQKLVERGQTYEEFVWELTNKGQP